MKQNVYTTLSAFIHVTSK